MVIVTICETILSNKSHHGLRHSELPLKVKNYSKTNVQATSDSYIAAKVLINVTVEHFHLGFESKPPSPATFSLNCIYAYRVSNMLLYRLVGIGWKKKFE